MRKSFSISTIIALVGILLCDLAFAAQIPVIDTVQPLQVQQVYSYDTSDPLGENSLFLIKNTGSVSLNFCITPGNLSSCPLGSYMVVPSGLVLVTVADLGLSSVTAGGSYVLNVSNSHLTAGTYIITPLSSSVPQNEVEISQANPADSVLRMVFTDSLSRLKIIGDATPVKPCQGTDPYWRTDGNNAVFQPFCSASIGTMNAYPFFIKTNSTVRMTVSTTGNVGIGLSALPPAKQASTLSNYMLSVVGKVIAEEYVVKLAMDWPDYVFGRGHKMLPLNQLETYVKTNKHLPGIPSAEEVSKNGVSVGDMLTKQMEKIEEMSLYLIELNKKIEALEEENQKIKEDRKK